MNLFSHKVVMGVLALVLAGGGYGGYRVVKNNQKYGVDFENRLHLVERVVDGDTIVIENGIRVRLLGIDAPESLECFGGEAKDRLSALVLGREVLLEKDQSAEDNYDRLLRYVILRSESPEADDLFVNKELVRGGYVKNVYLKPNRRYLSLLQSAEREARAESLGMWEECDFDEVVSADVAAEREQDSDPFSEECVIKGNINKRFEKDYFVVGCPNYKRVKIDSRKGEKWFCTEEEARDAGWKRSAACNNIWQTKE